MTVRRDARKNSCQKAVISCEDAAVQLQLVHRKMFSTPNPAAIAILALTVAVSLLGLYKMPRLIDVCLFRPYQLVRRSQYATIFTSGFVHADLQHLLFNLVTFYFFAFSLERTLGSVPFVALYAFGLVLSHLCTYIKQRNNPNYASLGASGAISAVLFAYIVYYPTATLFILPFPVPIPAALFAVGYVAWSWYSARKARGRINHDAHLCGALAGLAFVFVYDPNAFRRLADLLG
jgi:membrane associated rhomboid family serine protease